MQKRTKYIIAATVAAIGVGSVFFFSGYDTPGKVIALITGQPAGMFTPVADTRRSLDEVLTSWGLDKRTVINGHAVPPIPDPKLNAATLVGVDSDHNGIRDDLDRYIAEQFGNDPKYADVVIFEKAETKAVLEPTKENVIAANREMDCAIGNAPSYDKIYEKLSALTKKANSIGGRGGAYAHAFAGADIWSCNRK